MNRLLKYTLRPNEATVLSLAEPSYPGYFVLEVADGPIGLHTRKKENVPWRFARLNSNVLHCFWC